jgi:hypothetical protein
VVGDRPDLVQVVASRYLPNTVLAWGERYDSPLWDQRDAGPDGGRAFVCRNFTCQAPVVDETGLLAALTD